MSDPIDPVESATRRLHSALERLDDAARRHAKAREEINRLSAALLTSEAERTVFRQINRDTIERVDETIAELQDLIEG